MQRVYAETCWKRGEVRLGYLKLKGGDCVVDLNEFRIEDLVPESLINRFHLKETKDISGMGPKYIRPLIEELKKEKTAILDAIKLEKSEEKQTELHVICNKIRVLLNCKQLSKVGYA